MWPKKPARHAVSILTGKKTQFSHLCISAIPHPIGTKFATEVFSRKGSLHAKFEENLPSHFWPKYCFYFFIFFLLFPHLASIRLNHGELKGLIKTDLSSKFGRNPMNIHGIMTEYLHKIRSNFCHIHRINPLEERVEN